MITAPDSNIKFTDEQQAQLELFGQRLINAQTEIQIHNGVLRGIQADIVKATKEKMAIEQQKINLENSISSLTQKNENLKEEVQKNKKSAEEARIEADNLKTLHNATQEKLNAQAKDLSDKQAKIEADKLSIEQQKSELSAQLTEVKRKHNIFLETIKRL